MARFVAPAGEAAERPRQGVAVKRAEDIMIGGVAGRPLNAEQRQRLGLEAAAPAENGPQIVGARQHRRNRDGENRLQRKLPPLAPPPVRNRAQNVPQ